MSNVPITIDLSLLVPEIQLDNKEEPDIFDRAQNAVTFAHDMLTNGTGPGAKWRGWLNPDAFMPRETVAEISGVAEDLRSRADIMVVIGIGGSYLGTRAVIEALGGPQDGKQELYLGQTLSGDYTAQVLKALEGKRFCINVVSKSGTTTEPAVLFRVLRDYLIKQVGSESRAAELIVATTDEKTGTLHDLAKADGYRSLKAYIPDDVGGRFSVLTAVGLLPIAFAGHDIRQLLAGAQACAVATQTPTLTANPAYAYAAARNLLLQSGKSIELLVTFEPRLHFLAEWWKQLYGESEGKDGKGLFPASVEFTTDLHSMGQWIQDGPRAIFETFMTVGDTGADVPIPLREDDMDKLNYLLKDGPMTVDDVNKVAYQGTALAHRDGGVPSMTIALPDLSAQTVGALLYFFMKACGVSGYLLLGVNPFDQPGVEAYKQLMFALLGKKGPLEQAEAKAAVQKRLGQEVISF
jgi:glucose-6-phosphate isomerase